MKLVRTVALLVAHVASSTTRVHATRPDDWEQCADYPPNPTKDPIKITVTMDENGTADWATGNEAYWQTAKASIQELLQDATFNQVMGRVQELGLKNATDEIINVANDGYGAGAQYGVEYQQIAQLLDVELFDVIVFNYFYEIAGQCTSFVVNGPDGTVMHGRNLDYTDLGGYTENTNTQVEFVNMAGETQYTCTTWAGYVGCLTGMRSGRFSVSLNQRYFNPGDVDIEQRFVELIQELQNHQFDKLAFGIYLRTKLYDDVNFESIVGDVTVDGNDGNFVNNAYITIGGVATNQGAVLRVPGVFRAEEQGEDTAVLRIGTSAFPCFADYCFQTNEDSMAMLNNEGPTELFRWNGGVENLQAAISDAAPLTPNLLFSRVLLVCPTYVTKDEFLTVYSVAMVPATGAYEGKTVITSGDESPPSIAPSIECPTDEPNYPLAPTQSFVTGYWVPPLSTPGIDCEHKRIKIPGHGTYTCMEVGKGICRDNGGNFGEWRFGVDTVAGPNTPDVNENWTYKCPLQCPAESTYPAILDPATNSYPLIGPYIYATGNGPTDEGKICKVDGVASPADCRYAGTTHVCIGENTDDDPTRYSNERPYMFFYDEKRQEFLYQLVCDGAGEEGKLPQLKMVNNEALADAAYVGYPVDITKFKKGATTNPNDVNELWDIFVDWNGYVDPVTRRIGKLAAFNKIQSNFCTEYVEATSTSCWKEDAKCENLQTSESDELKFDC